MQLDRGHSTRPSILAVKREEEDDDASEKGLQGKSSTRQERLSTSLTLLWVKREEEEEEDSVLLGEVGAKGRLVSFRCFLLSLTFTITTNLTLLYLHLYHILISHLPTSETRRSPRQFWKTFASVD